MQSECVSGMIPLENFESPDSQHFPFKILDKTFLFSRINVYSIEYHHPFYQTHAIDTNWLLLGFCLER